MKKKGYIVEESTPNSKYSHLMEPNLTTLRSYVVDMLFNMGIPYHSLDIAKECYHFNIYEVCEGEKILVRYSLNKTAEGLEEFLNNVCEKYRRYYGFKITTMTE